MKITLPKHPIRDMTRQEKLLWLGSAGAVLLLLVFLPDVFSEDPDKKKKAEAEDGERREGA